MQGKLHPRLLAKYIFKRVGFRDPDVLIGPSYGEDAAIIKVENTKLIAVHADPITGAVSNIGKLAVNIACNDIAVRGAVPRWLVFVLCLPPENYESILNEITLQVDEEAKKLKVMVVGGHTEVTEWLDRPFIVMTCIGTIRDRYITTDAAKPGEAVIAVKWAALEGTSILASDYEDTLVKRGVSRETIQRAVKFIDYISVVKEALALSELPVSAMHDPTEGGVAAGLAEIAYASNVEIEVWEDKIPLRKETVKICNALNIDPLKLISSGMLIATIDKNLVEEAKSRMEKLGLNLSVIGEVKKGRGLIIHRANGKTEKVGPYVRDELFRISEEL